MYCDECKQQLASVHLTQMYQGKKVETHMCESCAVKKGAMMLNLDNHFSIPHILGSFLSNTFDIQEIQPLNSSIPNACPNCGMTIAHIRQKGKIGCSDCYSFFEQELESTLRRINGSNKHVGKTPSRSGKTIQLKNKLSELKTELQQAVASEQYEKAVHIRDSIKALEKELG